MRVAFIVTGFPVVSELFIVRQLTGLLERGLDVTIFAEPVIEPARHERIDEFELLRRTVFRKPVPRGLPARLVGALGAASAEPPAGMASMFRSVNPRRMGTQAFNLRLCYAAQGWARAGRFDVVHAHFGPNGVTAVDLRAIGCFDAPIVTTFHGYDINVVPGGPIARGYDRLFAECDAFTANSSFLAERAAKLGCPSDRIEVMPMGVDVSTRRPARVRSEGPMRALTVARLAEAKGIAHAITAVGHAVAAGAALSYRVIGGGPLEATLRAQVAALGLEDVVKLCGPASEGEVFDAYAASDVFVLPSIRGADGTEEAQGLVLQEAQAMELPVITTNIGGIPEGVDDGVSGYLVEPGDVETLAARLVECSKDPALRERMGRRGRELVEERYDIARLDDRLVELYEATRRAYAARRSADDRGRGA